MGFRFRRSIKIAPGIQLNLNKKSTSLTIGTRGAHHTTNSSGTRTTSIGLPGTGLSYTAKSSSNSSKPIKKSTTLSEKIENRCVIYKKAANFFLFLAIVFAIMSLFFLWCIPLSIGSLIIYFILLYAYYDIYIKEAQKIRKSKNKD